MPEGVEPFVWEQLLCWLCPAGLPPVWAILQSLWEVGMQEPQTPASRLGHIPLQDDPLCE